MSSGAARSSSSSGSSGSAKIQYVQQDFEPEYESNGNGSEGASSFNCESNLTRSHSEMNQLSTPYNSKTRLFSLQTREDESQFDVSVLRTIVSGISKALSGDSVVTAPALSRGFEWLGRVIIKPGPLEGPYYRRHRTYRVQGQILACGHVLPWRIGRSWRYSELHSLLVEELYNLVNKFSLQPHYAELISHFPPKNWQTRNSEETAEFRGAAIEAYVLRGIEITSMLLDSIPVEARLTKKQIERNKKRQRQRRRQRQLRRELGGGMHVHGNDEEGSASATQDSERDDLNYDSDSDESEPKCAEELEGELKQIMDIFVTKLLGIDQVLIDHLTQISNDLGKLISATPSTHSRVSKDFRVDPQQAL